MKLSDRANSLQPSATLEVVGKAKKMQLEGKPVISFGAGEPDFNSPESALKYASYAMENGKTHYTPASGIPELKNAISSYYSSHFNLEYNSNQIIVGAGAKPLLYEALGCLINPGDEVILLTPAWVSYLEQVRLFNGEAVCVDTSENGFQPTAEMLNKHISPKTRVIMVNSPNNPTGAVYDEKTLNLLADVAAERDIVIIFDEIYERLVYGSAVHKHILHVRPDIRDRCILINGVSKAYAMTGWRIGYALGPVEIISKMGSFQGHLTSNPCSVAQWAATGAITESEEDIEKMRLEFSARRELMLQKLSEMPLITFEKPYGAFYVWINAQKTFGMKYKGETIEDDSSFCKILLESEYVATVPGKAFLCPGFLRISYSNSREEITEGMQRLSRFLSELE